MLIIGLDKLNPILIYILIFLNGDIREHTK